MKKGQIEQHKDKEYKKDVIVASTSFLVFILLILSIINIESVGMRIAQFLDKLKPTYNLGPGGGYTFAAAIVIGLAISSVIGIIILVLMLVSRKRLNIHRLLLWSYFLITFIIQIYLAHNSYLDLVRETFNFLKSINFIIIFFCFTWYIYIPAIIMLLVYLIIKSIDNIRNNK